jgi:hypothetical protein
MFLHLVRMRVVVTCCSSPLDIKELFDALLVVVDELSKVVKLSHQFGLFIDILGDLGLIILLWLLLTVLSELSLENLHLCLEFIKKVLEVVIRDFNITSRNNFVHFVSLTLILTAA